VDGLPWDHATFDQAINRVHRITSKAPVDVYIAQVVCREDTDDFHMGASLDQKMRRLLRDKAQSAGLALDGAIPDIDEITIGQQQFLDALRHEWQTPEGLVDESALCDSLH
jgi:hypothetical protein